VDCTKSEAVDLTGEDPFTFVIQDFRFKPRCFIAKLSASVEIKNEDSVSHTWAIDDTVVNAPLIPHQTYTHGPSTGFLKAKAYVFHCSIHPQITGKVVFVSGGLSPPSDDAG
jgi:plastocyanin